MNFILLPVHVQAHPEKKMNAKFSKNHENGGLQLRFLLEWE